MAIAFTQRRAVNEKTDGNNHLIIPRLTKVEMSAVKFTELSAVTFEHYQGPKKPIPPPLPPRCNRMVDITRRQMSLSAAFGADLNGCVQL